MMSGLLFDLGTVGEVIRGAGARLGHRGAAHMSKKRISSKDLFRSPQAPTSSSPEEVAEKWGKKKLAENQQRQQALSGGSGQAEDSGSGGGGGGVWGWASDMMEDVVEVVDSVVDSVTESFEDLFEAAQEWYEQEPHIQVLELYGELGHTDAFLQALYDNDGYIGAALDMIWDDAVLRFLASPKLTPGLVDQFPGAAGSEMVRIFDYASHGDGQSDEVNEMLMRWVPTMTLEQIKPAFEARFDVALEEEEDEDTGETAEWSVEMLRAIWTHLHVLPAQDVSENTVLEAFRAIEGSGGFWAGGNSVEIGEDKNPDAVAHTVRHEIGHAVHTSISGTIDAWLQAEMNMWHHTGDSDGLDTWISELGGFPDKWTNDAGEEQDFGNAQETKVLAMLESYMGPGSKWGPARTSITDSQDADDVAAWNAMPANVQDAVTQSTEKWYNNYSNWASGTKGKYFLNYWYAVPYYMGSTAEAVVGATGENYTAMSYKEFFANCYAEYFEDPAGYADHSLWGGSLPASVQDFMKKHILERQPYTAPDEAANVDGQGDSPAVGRTPPNASGEAGTP